jgi:hypothetical protein
MPVEAIASPQAFDRLDGVGAIDSDVDFGRGEGGVPQNCAGRVDFAPAQYLGRG